MFYFDMLKCFGQVFILEGGWSTVALIEGHVMVLNKVLHWLMF